ncbi:hypothetical protein NP233_g8077 [Leucocoprinus birnbaumii]|uniref:Uncharacterized protein n=1 Tax=Leucocoprinus birnbaumii TaxID=56174 RepID=A0AAD5YNG1_9AGAR|nr:hypothetical protein NP233_g8077 [Leucocoprinus birnbaumii]
MDRFYDRKRTRPALHNVIEQAVAEESDVTITTLPWADVFGIVSVRAIPPFLRRFNQRNPPREYSKQGIVPTGLGDDLLLNQIQALTCITDRFANDPAFQSRLCLPYNESVFEDHPALCAGTCIFTQCSSALGTLEVPFEPGVDEIGTLMAFKPHHLVHCADNVVEYREKGNKKGVQLANLKPSAFAVGNIVELHTCVRWVSTSKHQAKSIVNLTRVTKISDVFRRDACLGGKSLSAASLFNLMPLDHSSVLNFRPSFPMMLTVYAKTLMAYIFRLLRI